MTAMHAINVYSHVSNVHHHHNVSPVHLVPITIVHLQAVLCNVPLVHFMILQLLFLYVQVVQIHVLHAVIMLQTVSVVRLDLCCLMDHVHYNAQSNSMQILLGYVIDVMEFVRPVRENINVLLV
jgi:hypothetical protein